jgi:hypothetical protein
LITALRTFPSVSLRCACFIVKRKADGKDFEALPDAQGDPGDGIGGYDLARPEDRAFAFDYDGFGKLDHLVVYRPGSGPIYIFKESSAHRTVPLARISTLQDRRELFKHPLKTGGDAATR